MKNKKPPAATMPLYQVLSVKKLSRILRPDAPWVATKPVPSPSAHYPVLCGLNTAAVASLMERAKAFLSNSAIEIQVRMLTELMMLHGLRVSEVLRINASHISPQGRILIKASKGSRDRWVTSTKFTDLWIGFRANRLNVNDHINRFYIYRLFKKYGLYAAHSQGVYAAVTHVFRKMLALDSFALADSLEDISLALGHQSLNSALYYAPKHQ